MKLTKLFLTAALALTFSTTVNADTFKTNVCLIAETSYWDAYKKATDNGEHDIVRNFGEGQQIAYFKLLKSDLMKTMNEVTERCAKMDKVVSSQYTKTIEKLNIELSKLY